MKVPALILGLAIIVSGANYSVIVSKNLALPTISPQEIRDIYLQKRHTIGNQQIIPVNLVGQDEVRSEFEAVVLGMDRNSLNMYWVKQHFQGNTPPVTQPSFESIKVFVKNVEGSMGYIPSKMVDNSVRVIYEF